MTMMKSYAILSDWRLYNVGIGNNYFDGRYSNYSYRTYRVIATSQEQAKQIVLDNADYILEQLLSMKYRTRNRRLLSKNKALPITEKRIGNAWLDHTLICTSDFVKILSPKGLIKVKINDHQIEDMIFPEDELA